MTFRHVSTACQLCSLPARIKSRLCPRISFNAFPQLRHAKPLPNIAILHCCPANHHTSLPLPFNTRNFHSFPFVAFFGLPLLIATPLRTSDLFAALPLLSASIQCRCVAARIAAHAKLLFSAAFPVYSSHCRCRATLIRDVTFLRASSRCHRGARQICSLPLLFMAPHFHALAQTRNAIL